MCQVLSKHGGYRNKHDSSPLGKFSLIRKTDDQNSNHEAMGWTLWYWLKKKGCLNGGTGRIHEVSMEELVFRESFPEEGEKLDKGVCLRMPERGWLKEDTWNSPRLPRVNVSYLQEE